MSGSTSKANNSCVALLMASFTGVAQTQSKIATSLSIICLSEMEL